MTTFEIIVIILLAVIIMLLILVFTGMATTHVKMKEGFEHLSQKIECCKTKLGYIEDAKDDVIDALRDICLTQELGKTSPNVPASLPCYAPNGICTNPQMDCINCPKHGAGGVWSTSTNTINKD